MYYVKGIATKLFHWQNACMRKKTTMRGRPKKKFPLDAQVIFMCRPEQKARYVEASEAARMEFSEWLRSICDRAADSELGKTNADS
jgi:hypothetical protein